MSLSVNTNISSLNAQRNLSKSQLSYSRSLERLSSGLRINSAKDDAAGLAISDRMTSQIRGLNQATRNAHDGISLAQTAEGAMQETTNIIQRIRELAVQSANDTNSASDRTSMQSEVNQLIREVDRIANNTSFNNQKILDGTFTDKKFQIGANAMETISLSVDSMKAADLGRYNLVALNMRPHNGTGGITTTAGVGGEGGFSVPAWNTINTQDVTINGADGSATINIIRPTSSQANQIAELINEKTIETGVVAEGKNQIKIGRLSGNGSISFDIGFGVKKVTIFANVTTNDLNSLAQEINKHTNKTGITATATGGELIMVEDDGEDLAIGNFTHYDQPGATIYATGWSNWDINDPRVPRLTSGARDSNRATGYLEMYSDKLFTSTSTITGDSIFNLNAGIATSSEKQALAEIDISSVDGANDALGISDASLRQIDSQRAELGAIQNRFESTISNLQNVSENLSAARSRILDADIAQETSGMTKQNILQQAGTTILSQANQQPELALSLLK
jgi:flagellin